MHASLTAIRRAVAVAVPALATAALLAAPAHAQAAELTITKYHGGVAQRWVLICDPDDGNHPDPFAACDRLREIGGDLDQIRFRPDVPCPRIFDPVDVQIHGHFHGEPLDLAEQYPNPCFVERLAAPIVP
ncbi:MULTISPECIES: SSI family serine proteinase inhibitor [unclassified Nonomuraea]|uniref:SSI family serine proteinase inhibitor n=1 Tax=unclassified Nonomuraea TaxID=2593643 RepID=UPI0035C0DE02